jgi:hypothetical protein
VRVHVHAGAIPTVLEQALRPRAIVVAHRLRHLLHPLDVEKHDRSRRESLALRRDDRVVSVRQAALGSQEIGIAGLLRP